MCVFLCILAVIRCRELRRAYEGPIHAYVKASLRDCISGESGIVKRTAVHRATPAPVFHEILVLRCPPPIVVATVPRDDNDEEDCTPRRQLALDIAVWHRDRKAR